MQQALIVYSGIPLALTVGVAALWLRGMWIIVDVPETKAAEKTAASSSPRSARSAVRSSA